MGTPVVFAHLLLDGVGQSHLREEEGAVGVDASEFAGAGATCVETPIPGRKDKDIRDPESRGGSKEIGGG